MQPLALLTTGIVAFVTTNVEDLLILIVLFTQPEPRKHAREVMAGYCLGVGVLILFSIVGALGLLLVPDRLFGLLGLVPIVLGVWMLRRRRASREPEVTFAGIFSLTISQGADNLVVYIPLFARIGWSSAIVVVAVFAAMLALYCLATYRLGDKLVMTRTLQRIGRLEPPVVFILVGCYVFVVDGLLRWL
jgi:cadmium resistance protein CadD (predicted permease)